MLGAGLITILCTGVYAEEGLISIHSATIENNTNFDHPQVLALQETKPNFANQPKVEPATTTPAEKAPETQPASTTPVEIKIDSTIVKQPEAPKPLDCNYHIPPETTRIEQTVVMKWAEKAAAQSFDLDFNTIDKQLSDLKACYTEQGWQGFNDALEKSGNLNAIKTQHLVVSSMPNGEGKINEIKDNQWKVSLPLQVVYQNEKEKLTQPLTIDLVISRKVSGDLGIMQMIAIPRQTNAAKSE